MITKPYIKNLFSSTIYQRGLRYYNLGKVQNLTYDDLEDCWEATVLGSEPYHVNIQNLDHTISYTCSCPAHDQYGSCKHSVAVLLEIADNEEQELTQPTQRPITFSDYLKQTKSNPIRRNTSRDFSSEMIDIFTNRYQSDDLDLDYTSSRQPLQLEFTLKPQIQAFVGDFLSVEMKVGVDRTYVVKNLKEFLKSLAWKKEHYFTPNFIYDPELHYFKDEDQEVIDILLDIYRNERFYENKFYPASNQRGMTIPPFFAKQFLPKIVNHRCSYEGRIEKYRQIYWHVDEVPFEFSLKDIKQNYVLNYNSLNQSQYYKEYGVIQVDHNFYDLNRYQKNVMDQLYQLLNTSQKPQIPIKQHQIDTFISQVLPNLRQIGNVKLSKQVEKSIVNPPLHATMHLDREEERLTANIQYRYGNIVIDPMQPEKMQKPHADQILLRDAKKEQEVMRVIEHAAFKYNGSELYLEKEDEIFSFLYELLPQFEDYLDIYLTRPVKNWLWDDLTYPTVNVDLESSEDFLEINFDLGDVEQGEINHILQSVVEKKRYYRLPNGAFVPLQDESLSEVTHLFDELRLKPDDMNDGKLQLPAYRGLQIDEAVSQGLKTNYNETFNQLVHDIKHPEELSFTIPTSLKADLRDYQNVGFQWMKSLSRYRFGGILADDMGLGKTLQSIAFLLSEIEEKRDDRPALVVSPASLVYNWQAEFEKFAPSMNIRVISGSIAERKELLQNLDNVDVIMTSYPLIRQDVEFYRELEFSTLILDEAQAIKNDTTKQAKAIREIRAARRFALSGTPIENSLDELWSIFDVILPGFFPNKKEFRNLPQEQISRMSRPFILRRVKQDVLTELPDKIESVQHSELTIEQKQLYLGYLEQIQGEAADAISTEGFQKSRMRILAGLTRLRQLCCHPSLFIENYEGESGKLNQLFDMVNTARENDHRILIFSQFSSMLKIIHDELQAMGRDVFYLDGQTPSKDRVKMVERFNQGEKDIFLISLKAGGTGLNLTGADTVILYDLWWNPAVEEQAAGRAHRMGQKNVVQVHRLVTKGTIEEKIYALQQRKRELIENVIQPGETMFQSLSEDEIRELLNV
ncbi:DEAD/DEAH box helicase [Tenuibacillus multivorans]|uniref:Superfamily II DNA or RNA helicase, SNF2 family n=1 Tax=Tenuibacillus multivorans TaxID=237069 RepID=A0A1H0DYF7_9BACI|nr:DEAD/DEAH box helicase [Tenuibacillus multivorans]GEL76727.1 helicase SNF2 [Tenuibacillus multivorans]SDN75182.1 Superfamily II DNA or RNA helicase, SNF2 family [Tenuibacillus multivorans]